MTTYTGSINEFTIAQVENGYILEHNGSTYIFSSLKKVFKYLEKQE